MRNLKLLLATTAMLSIGAMVANADTPTTPVGTLSGEYENVEVNIELIEAISLDNTVPLDFGRIVFKKGVQYLDIEIDDTGKETLNQVGPVEGSAYILTPGTRGVVTGATCNQLSYPNSVVWTSGIMDGSGINDLHCKNGDNSSIFYGRLLIDPSADIEEGIYTNSFTVTLIPTIYDN